MAWPKFLRVISILILTAVPLGCGLRPRVRPLPQDPAIQAYFNQSQAAVYRDPYRKAVPSRYGDNFEAIILQEIENATRSIDVAVQEIRLPLVAKALVRKHQAGVRVRVILENTYNVALSQLTEAQVDELNPHSRSRYEEVFKLIDTNGDGRLSPDEVNNGDAIIILQNGNVPLIDDTADGSKGSGLMHHKFMVFDDRRVLVTSANFTTSDMHGDFGSPESRGNPNALLVIDSPEVARLFIEEFNFMWGDGPGGATDSRFGIQKPLRAPQTLNLGSGTVTVMFSPARRRQWHQSTNALIAETLSQAQRSIDLALFVFSEQPLVDAMEPLTAKGVRIRALIEPDFAYKYYSEALDMWGIALPRKGTCKYEPNNAPWSNPVREVGVPKLPKGDRLHHKFGLIDNYIVIVGSHNWTPSGNHNNDETLLVIRNATVAAHFQREFERLMQKVELGPPGWLLKAVKEADQTCGGLAHPYR
ncbi:MAG: phospholipase D-like domain-containing protein [Gloeomargarita sp. SKYBB_i_bin120]|nr:phospholipase D-like domain-containing protein [Gloeomargarita sp. SKYG98]MCS7291404.1 phospholipase D-like domain-containing protein [Gloeomargarita sp. SKYB120]MDW8176964.1 phospholipase D-like domain-containing protein [Gloeomargarita sp. SKYBB_i_bin120]